MLKKYFNIQKYSVLYTGESTGFENNGVPRKATAKIVDNSECQLARSNNTQVNGNHICIIGDLSGSSCVVS